MERGARGSTEYAGRRAHRRNHRHPFQPARTRSVLDAIEATGVEEVWCLGDVLGYGVEPDACADLVRERCDICLVGNHDLAVLGGLDIAAFSEAAAVAVGWTREPTSPSARSSSCASWSRAASARASASSTPPRATRSGSTCSRASRPTPASTPTRAGRPDRPLPRRRSSSPGPEGEPGETRGAQTSDGALLDLGSGAWLVNPGSVGQPRDGDPRAAWLELDTEAEISALPPRPLRDRSRRRADRRRRPPQPPRRPPLHRPVTLNCRANPAPEVVL